MMHEENEYGNVIINILSDIFYVYILLDPRKPGVWEYGESGKYKFDYEPFYVGKGSDYRCYEHLYKCNLKENTYKNNKIKKLLREGFEVIIVKVKENLLECDSFELEIELIKTIGRTDLGLGPLTNCTDGGEGVSGQVVSNETKKKRSGENHWCYNSHFSEEHKQKLSESHIGKKLSKESCKKHSESISGENHWSFQKPRPEETRNKISVNMIKYYTEHPGIRSGKNHPRFNSQNSDESNRKNSESHKGKKSSDETRKKISESGKLVWKTRKRNQELKKLQEINNNELIMREG